MVDHIVDGSERRGRIDIRVRVGGRRRWCAEDKGRIVAESYAPGAVASEVARRHEITPQHLFAWRKAARAGRLTLPAEEAPMFVPVVTTTREVGAAGALANRPGLSRANLRTAAHPWRSRMRSLRPSFSKAPDFAVLVRWLRLRRGHLVPVDDERLLAHGCHRVRHCQVAARAGRRKHSRRRDADVSESLGRQD